MAESRTKLEGWIEAFRIYISGVRRYSARTCALYTDALADFAAFAGDISVIDPAVVRDYEVHLLDGRSLAPKTVNLHLSVLSSFCTFLVRGGDLEANPVKSVRRPKIPKRLPEFYREDELSRYFLSTDIYASKEFLDAFRAAYAASLSEEDPDLRRSYRLEAKDLYEKRLERVIVSALIDLGIRRSELIGMNVSDFDPSRRVVTVRGKGNKMREIPVVESLCEEILLYLKAVETLRGGRSGAKDAMFLTWRGERIYPVLVDRAVKGDFAALSGVTGRRSPHILRHTLATELLDEGTDLNSIKEMLGHSSLATTQIYTHNSIVKLKNIYETAHPRAKSVPEKD